MEREYQDKLFELEVDFEDKLNTAKQFVDLSKQLQKAFYNEDIHLYKKAKVVKDEENDNEWRIIDESGTDIEAYHLKLNYDEITERKWIDISGDSKWQIRYNMGLLCL